MAFDKHLNMVLGDSEELRKLPPKKGQEEVRLARTIGQCECCTPVAQAQSHEFP